MSMARYDQYADGWDTAVSITIDGESVKFFHALVKGVHRVFVDHPLFLAKVGIETEKVKEWKSLSRRHSLSDDAVG